ncbi:MAG: hypothetical protein NZM25_00040 [Leptospiraceae bacterium]|nr:hypothetical protein [Leptospiraceae bacterium]MDW8307570.1 hypothetical protein [Leptospiraceae bacterium]
MKKKFLLFLAIAGLLTPMIIAQEQQSEEGKIKIRRMSQRQSDLAQEEELLDLGEEKEKTASEKGGVNFRIPKPFFFNMYFRASVQDDFGYNAPTLGWWPFYGRLMNETPWLMADFGYHVVRPESPGAARATLFLRIEGGSYRSFDASQGTLGNYNINHIWLETENVLMRHLVTQTGSLWYNLGYIGLFDNFTAQVFWETIGIRVGHRLPTFEYFVGYGDSGWAIYRSRRGDGWHGHQYANIPTVGALVRVNLYEVGPLKSFTARFLPFWQMGATVQVMYERQNENLRGSPHQTPQVSYQDVLRGEAFEKFMLENPGSADYFPWAQPMSVTYGRATFWTGFSGPELGPIKLYWNDFSLRLEKKPPQIAVTESYEGETKDIYISGFTDERYELMLFDELQLRLLPNYFDLNAGFGFGRSWDQDNRFRPDDHNRLIYSFVFRPIWYITEQLHYLIELVYAREKSTVGNRYREHFNSMKSNTRGVPDADGLEWGDTDTKHTYQIKTGFTINPAGRGIYSRPTIRLLYGAQFSNVHAAFGNTFEESLSRRNQFAMNRDVHWHHMVRAEFEHWFSVSGYEEGVYTPPLAQQLERLSQEHAAVPVDPTRPKKYDIYVTAWGAWALQLGPLTMGLGERLRTDPDGCKGLTRAQCRFEYSTGGVSFGSHLRVRGTILEYTGGIWYFPIYKSEVRRITGNVFTNVDFLNITGGVRYFFTFLPKPLSGIYTSLEGGYGIPLITHLVGGQPKSLDLGLYLVASASAGFQYRFTKSVSIEGELRTVFMPTTPIALALQPTFGASYHID